MHDHAVVVRMHYPEGSSAFFSRLEMFREGLLPSLLRQTHQDFDIWVRINPWQQRFVEALHPRLQVFWAKPEWENYVRTEDRERSKRYFIDFCEYAWLENFPSYTIQTGVDSDDLVESQWLEKIMDAFATAKAMYGPKRSYHVSFQPIYCREEKSYAAPVKYNHRKGSAFFSLYQPDPQKRIFAYHDSHLKLWQYVYKSFCLEAGDCFVRIHDKNATTRLTEKTTAFPDARVAWLYRQ